MSDEDGGRGPKAANSGPIDVLATTTAAIGAASREKADAFLDEQIGLAKKQAAIAARLDLAPADKATLAEVLHG